MYAQTTPKSVADEGNACKRRSDSDTGVAVGQCPGAGQAKLGALADRIELWSVDLLRPYERNRRTHSDGRRYGHHRPRCLVDDVPGRCADPHRRQQPLSLVCGPWHHAAVTAE